MAGYVKQNLSSGQILTANCLNVMDEGIYNNSTFYENLNEADYIILKNNTEYTTSQNISSLSVSFPDIIETSFHCSLDFGSGDQATNFIYPDMIIWSGDSLSVEKKFIPIKNYRYHIDFWFDGLYIRGNVSGVIV